MADLASSLVAYLGGTPALSALIGDRLWPDVPPQEYDPAEGPALTYFTIHTTHEHSINGLSGIARARIEFTAWAGTRAAADAVAEAVRRSGLAGFIGDLYGVWVESVMIDSGVQHLEERPNDGTQRHRYLAVFDYLICYQETR